MTYVNPFEGKTPRQIYDLLTQPELSGGKLPCWPNETVQTTYTGAYGPQIIQSGLEFLAFLEKDGAFKPGWRGLDYGCGFGRFASLLLAKGGPEQLDLVDAWSISIENIAKGGFRNKCWTVSELLADTDLEPYAYDLITTFSVFTHFSKKAFLHNIERLHRALKTNGKLYFTVRHDEFIPVKYPQLADEIQNALATDGIWFKGTPGNLGQEPIFGDTIVSTEFMEELGKRFGPTRRLGAIRYQHVWVMDKS
ncbi:bifunctional 2-polyprenyl-6-hydroxyphenol methylase/3-demethylubiquinol 3-O-methyltransferase UbiG [Methylocystis sp. ATCC 49242]|uniref:class I SAM-dependent methyltransferase n=1 Tax=Methylocystis sp. ATCC 49242 TaxID=622637 RepID=UPI0001F887F4|nr:class I SAM-dependent methyltransferase [Methylocystis sp. ATCC 49242]